MKKQLLFAFGAAALLASCSNEIDTPQVGQNGQLRVNATIEGLKTRMTGTAWEGNDKIGISDDGNTYTNVPYVYGNTTFEAVNEAIVLKGASDYTFNAYYPYAEDGGTVEFDVVDDNNAPKAVKEVDFLYASGATAKRTAPEVDFSFQHKMARLALTFTSDGYLEEDAKISYKLSSVATTGEFNTATGEVTPGEAEGTVEVASATLDVASALILPSYAPANTDAIKVVVTVVNDGETVNYSGTITPALLAGNQYNYTLEIVYGKELVVKGATIGSWTEKPGTLDDGGLTEDKDNGTEGDDNEGDDDDDETDHVTVVGDYLLKDGSILPASSEELEDKKNDVVAVVFYTSGVVENYNNGLAVALKNANNEAQKFFTKTSSSSLTNWWGTNNDGSTVQSGKESLFYSSIPTEGMNGYKNTELLKEAEGEFNFETLLTEYNEDNTVKDASDWYLPSFIELVELGNVLTTVQTSLGKVDGELKGYDTFTKDIQNSNFYWSTDFYRAGYNWTHPLGESQASGNDFRVSAGNADKPGYFRFIIAF